MDVRTAMTAILYVLRTGCQWRALPRSLGAGTTVHDRFQQWVEAGVFKKMWKAGRQLDSGGKRGSTGIRVGQKGEGMCGLGASC
jgi:transposase